MNLLFSLLQSQRNLPYLLYEPVFFVLCCCLIVFPLMEIFIVSYARFLIRLLIENEEESVHGFHQDPLTGQVTGTSYVVGFCTKCTTDLS